MADATHNNPSNEQTPLPHHRQQRRRRGGRRRGRGAVRRFDLAVGAREGGRRAGRGRHQQGRAGAAHHRRVARQGVLGAQPHASRCSARCRSSTSGSPIRIPTFRNQPPYCKNEHRSIKERCGSPSASARTSAARPRSGPRSRRRTWVPTGSAASSVLATSRSSTSPAASTRAMPAPDQPRDPAAQVPDRHQDRHRPRPGREETA